MRVLRAAQDLQVIVADGHSYADHVISGDNAATAMMH